MQTSHLQHCLRYILELPHVGRPTVGWSSNRSQLRIVLVNTFDMAVQFRGGTCS